MNHGWLANRGRDIWLGLRTPPHPPRRFWALAAAYGGITLLWGSASGLLNYSPLDSKLAPLLPLSLLLMPSLTEELVFRGLLIPRDVSEKGGIAPFVYIAASTTVYVLWHPFYAHFINPKAAVIFMDPRFLIVAAFLGAVCGAGYVWTRSLWVPVLTHWTTVMVWVFLFGGRNLVLD